MDHRLVMMRDYVDCRNDVSGADAICRQGNSVTATFGTHFEHPPEAVEDKCFGIQMENNVDLYRRSLGKSVHILSAPNQG